MTKREEYGLDFRKTITNGNVYYSCVRKNEIVDKNNLLQFLNYLDIKKTEFLLREVNSFLDTTPNPNWTPYESMVLEHIDLTIDYPNLLIDEQPHSFPLTDIKILLQEWLDFLKK